MNSANHHTLTWLLESQLAPHVDAFMLHLFDCRYASNTILSYDFALFNSNQFLVTAGKMTLAYGKAVAIFRFFDLRTVRTE